MTVNTPATIYLKDYTAPEYSIQTTQLRFELFEEYTFVHATLGMVRNAKSNTPLILDGDALELTYLKVNGETYDRSQYSVEHGRLVINDVPAEFSLSIGTKIFPQSNTSLEGLYRSRTMYCTQCEAEGFRKITYYLDRPDVLSVFSVRIEASEKAFPILLSNGNCTSRGRLDDGRHFTEWHDPYPKPSYLFALVAGDLACVTDTFVTCSGRTVAIELYVEEKDVDKCSHAITSLKNAMTWDENVYGREYDLDVYMIVAVDDFNMGAMENKGLNVFNTSCVLASEETTTDQGFQRVEGVIAHEYFHNWSGNRVTCRDWFQLSLKEGFTVFRDEEFSADMGSRTVKRVEDVQLLRSLQFAEDAGPMAHPVRPASYIEISNFYTLTVYEKGAEVVRMIHTLLGEELFREGSDRYFEQHDGSAATIEDFVQAMADVSGRDFSQFMMWYSQAGTPKLQAAGIYNAEAKTYTITFKQTCPSTPEATSESKSPYLIPVAMGLVGESGVLPLTVAEPADSAVNLHSSTHAVLDVTMAEQTFTFNNVGEEPIPALLRNFSAPVNLDFDYNDTQLLTLMKYEDDGFCRWDASQKLAVRTIMSVMSGRGVDSRSALVVGLKTVLTDAVGSIKGGAGDALTVDPAMVALMLTLPSEEFLGLQCEQVDVDAIHAARNSVRKNIAQNLELLLWDCYQACLNALSVLSGVNAQTIALRSLKNCTLNYLMLLDKPTYQKACVEQFHNSKGMSDVFSALTALVHCAFDSVAAVKEEALSSFYNKWKHESLVVNQWFAVQASNASVNAFETVKGLLSHVAYDHKNPNKIRSVIGVFCNQNLVSFHHVSGQGYAFLADQILLLNETNPQVAARLVTPLSKWKRYDKERQALMQKQLKRIVEHKGLSKDVFEIASKSLNV